MRIFVTILFILVSMATTKAQSSYTGYLDKYPITFVVYQYSDGVTLAYYVYDNHDTPIVVNGLIQGADLELLEKNELDETQAILHFPNFDISANNLKGTWISSDSSRQYSILLEKELDITYGDEIEWGKRELLQAGSTKEHYFKTIISKTKDDFFARIVGVNIYEKKTDRLLQTIPLDCQLHGIDNVSIGDFNFDGILDFSVFEASYAGPNTSSIYILWDPISSEYVVSDFTGTSLWFDEEEKRVYEHNQCCAGTMHMNATYKIVDDKMVLIEQVCLEYDEELEDLVEVECEQ